MRRIAMLGAVAALGLGGSVVAGTSASAAEPALEWRQVTGASSVQLDRRCWQTQHVWDHDEALADIPCTPKAQFPDGTWVMFYVASTDGSAPTDLEWRQLTSSTSVQLDRRCWQHQHGGDPEALPGVPCTPGAQLPDRRWITYYLAHKAI